MNACALIPIYDHGSTVASVVAELAPPGVPCLIVDDGSGAATRDALRRLAADHPNVEVVRRDRNGGKGAALKTGYRAALARGFTHAVQLDADGQHRASDVARFIAAMRANPDALVLGVPVFDASAPRARIYARQISRVLVWLACLSRVVPDPLCGFRGIPLIPTVALLEGVRTGDWMDFEPEMAVRSVWQGLPIVPLPTAVAYPLGGISHFSIRRDYPLLASLYFRLLAGMLLRAPELLRARSRGQRVSSGKGDWSALAESGTMGAIRFFTGVHRVLGRPASLALLWLTVAYFYVRERAWRGESRRYLEAVWSRPEGRAALGRRPGALTPFLHYREFARQTFDRMLLWGDGLDCFQMDHRGSEHLFRLARERRGALLLGAHVGSFDMARTLAKEYGIVLNVVMFTRHAERINRLFEELDPDSRLRVVHIDPDSVKTAFAIKACIDRGELVGLLADRVPAGSREQPIWVDFLGARRPFPRSPFALACLLGCPTYVSLCVRVGGARYYTHVEQLSAGVRLPRSEREKGAEELALAYVRELEKTCLRHPYQWFNFYQPTAAVRAV